MLSQFPLPPPLITNGEHDDNNPPFEIHLPKPRHHTYTSTPNLPPLRPIHRTGNRPLAQTPKPHCLQPTNPLHPTAPIVSTFVSATASFRADWKTLYDQAGLILLFPHSSSSEASSLRWNCRTATRQRGSSPASNSSTVSLTAGRFLRRSIRGRIGRSCRVLMLGFLSLLRGRER